MSFIGPRPWITDYFDNMSDVQKHRYCVRPGLTGLAQCNGRNAITIFDKIRYDLEYVEKYSLRQDPDIILIGEIRDRDTAKQALSAAETGHLVFSTLHTNDAISAVARVVDMGMEPYLISGALIGVEAQRLVRKLCPHCKQKITLTPIQLDHIIHLIPGDFQFYAPVGCEKCTQTGYLGREMISEVLPISDKISSLIAKSASKEEIANAAFGQPDNNGKIKLNPLASRKKGVVPKLEAIYKK